MTGLWTLQNEQLHLNFHPGQTRAWRSDKRFIVVLAGTQGGKTSWGPWWLWREIQRTAQTGAGNDYIAATASYDLFKLKMLPALRETFEHVLQIGRYWSSDRIIELCDMDPASPRYREFYAKRSDDPMWGRIILRSAESGGGLESNTAKAAWLDEAGQESFTLDAWEAVQRRLSIAEGRALLTTTIYNLGWIKHKLYDRRGEDPTIDVIQFDSTENPAFPRAEYDRARAELPLWKFNMFYRGQFERPAGLIYASFDRRLHTCPRFAIPDTWPRLLGMDFGPNNTAGLFYAVELSDAGVETGRVFLYREYKAGGKTAAAHAKDLLRGEPMIPRAIGGSLSEDKWRAEFRDGGLPIGPPDVKDVEIGISRVYGAHTRHEVIVFDDCAGYLDQKASYSRETDSTGEPTDVIANKATYHFMDAERYILGWKYRGIDLLGFYQRQAAALTQGATAHAT